jgi:16S rRNA (cytosine967-C5)-methyltransferase
VSDASLSPSSDPLAARQVALTILDGVLTRRQPLDAVLDSLRDLSSLPVRDRAFVRMLAATALRHLGQIDAILKQASARDEAPSPAMLHHLLRLGVTQILFMDVPDYAAVDTSVRLAEQMALSRQSGFVNAVLRHVTRQGRDWLKEQDAAILNVPAWLMGIWQRDYGIEAAHAIAEACCAEAPLDITPKNPGDAAYWAGTLHATVLPTGTVRRVAGGQIIDLPGFDEGLWWVQDASAALPALLLGEVKGRTVLDLCAAPGGKTAQLAAGGAHVVALDRSAKRLKRLEDNIARLGLTDTVQAEVADAASWTPKSPASHILLDAPCTATGTIRRNPDVLHLKTRKDMDGLMDTQARLLESAVRMLAPGGVLVYCTCSLQKDEGERQIARLLDKGAPVKRLPVDPGELGGLDSLITPEGDVRILPFHLAPLGGMDGFYISRLVKSA